MMKTSHISKNIFISFLFALLFVLAPGSAYSFDFEGLDLELSTSISEIYDDNITQVHEDEKDDFITNLSFGLGAKSEKKTRSFELAVKIIQQIFAEYDDYNKTSQELSFDFFQEFSKYSRISLKDVFSHTYEPRTFEEAFGRTTGRYSHYRNRFNLAYTKDIAKQLSIIAKYANEVDEIAHQDLKDSVLNSFGLQLDYFPTSATILMFSYDFANRDFDPGEDASTHSIAAGLRHYLTRQLYFDGKAGIDLIDSYTDKDYTKSFTQLSLTSDIDENSRASISFAKKYYTSAYSEDLFDYWQTSGIFTRQLFKRLAFSLSGFYGEGEYIASNITDKLRGANIGFTYDLTRNLKGNLSYTYSNVNSTLDTRDYIRNRVFLGLTMEF